jgi:hypothetical protein
VGERVTQNQETGPFILLSSIHLQVKTAAMAMSPLKEFPNLYDDYDSMINNNTVEKMMKPKSKYFELRFEL